LFAVNSKATADESLQKTYKIETANKRTADVIEALIGYCFVTMGKSFYFIYICAILSLLTVPLGPF